MSTETLSYSIRFYLLYKINFSFLHFNKIKLSLYSGDFHIVRFLG